MIRTLRKFASIDGLIRFRFQAIYVPKHTFVHPRTRTRTRTLYIDMEYGIGPAPDARSTYLSAQRQTQRIDEYRGKKLIFHPISKVICIEIRSVPNQKRYAWPAGELGIICWHNTGTLYVYMAEL